jgi:NAD-dependent SIR2 family protein deacetylase
MDAQRTTFAMRGQRTIAHDRMRTRRYSSGMHALPDIDAAAPVAGVERLAGWLGARGRVVGVTGAGVSTASGIPDYRDDAGEWKRSPPVQYHDFVTSDALRRRYWARSFSGWPMFRAARPNAAHLALARLEAAGRVASLVTQNVDRLHQRAGSRNVVDLHGRLDVVRCLACGYRTGRDAFQQRLRDANPAWTAVAAPLAPDGDADVEAADFASFDVPACAVCGGMLKPDVVFYGEAVPRETTAAALAAVEAADGMLVAGSSLMVWSSFRLVRAAVARGLEVVAVNRGRTRGDNLLAFKLDRDCGAVLEATLERLGD